MQKSVMQNLLSWNWFLVQSQAAMPIQTGAFSIAQVMRSDCGEMPNAISKKIIIAMQIAAKWLFEMVMSENKN